MNWSQILDAYTKPLFTMGNAEISLATIVGILVLVALLVLLSRFTRHILRTRILARTKLDSGLQYLISSITGYVVLVLGLVIGLQTVGIDLSSLTVLAGALGVGIGFGLQTIVNNFVSGLIIMGERAIQIGDRVDVAGTLGEVMRIGARSTSVRTNDNILIIVPNSEFVSNRVINWSHMGDPKVRIRVPLGVSYGSNPRQVEQILLQVAGASSHVLQFPKPIVVFRGYGDSSLDFELRVWTSAKDYWPGVFKSHLYFAIWDAFKENGIEIPFPQRDVHVKEPVKVELTGQS